MLIHPWDQATRDEWREVLRVHDFGQLISAGRVDGYPVEKAAIVAAQLAHHERPGSTRVTPSVEIESDRRQLAGIRGLRVRIESVKAKQRYGGNKDVDHRRAIADHLAERGAPGDAAARQHLLRRGT